MAIFIDTSFPGGGADQVRIDPDGTITFNAPVDGSLTDRSLWFYFCVRNAKGQKLHFVLDGMSKTLDPYYAVGYAAVRPVTREGSEGSFTRVPAADICVEMNPLSFSFNLTPASDETYVAFCHPYQYADLMRFVEAQVGRLAVEIIGKTGEGRPYPVLLAGFDSDRSKKLLVISARQHSGETPSSFVLEGFLQQYLALDETGAHLREHYALLALPMGNLDGVEQGRYGKDAPPIDFNRAWEAESIRVEIRGFLNHLEELLKTYRPGVYVDFHAPQPGGYSYVVPARVGTMCPEDWRRTNLLIDRFEERTAHRAACRRQDLDPDYVNWIGEYYLAYSGRVMAERFGFYTVCLESSYHVDCHGRHLAPEDWRFMGWQFAGALCDVWLEDYDKPGVDTAVNEILWDGWEMVERPIQVKVAAKPGEFTLTATGRTPAAFFGDGRMVNRGECGGYKIACDGQANLVCHVYHYKDGKVAKRSRVYPLFVGAETLKLPFDLFALEGYDHFRMAFHVTELKGSLSVTHTG